MYFFAYLILVASFLLSVFSILFIGQYILKNSFSSIKIRWVEKSYWTIFFFTTIACLVLLYAFISYDFRVEYVANYSSLTLPFFYRVTAFWAGQPGSMLFWAWTVLLGGAIFLLMPSYKKQPIEIKAWYWCFFFNIIAFFLLMLLTWCNPFVTLQTPPADGRGLVPLLQNLGMVFHPPLLFLGYGGFTVPGCLALAVAITSRYTFSNRVISQKNIPSWQASGRTFILLSWIFLTSGIVLGAWWAYMELGWGGYWAWDPVENASLIPWLVATAYLHTSIIEKNHNKLHRCNIFLVVLTTISAFFATYLVRSGVIESLHAFGAGSIGTPLLLFVLFFLLVTVITCVQMPKKGEQINDLFSKEGVLLTVTCLLLALSFIVLIATLWPLIISGAMYISTYLPDSLSKILPSNAMGLSPSFYNQTCLPLFAIFPILLTFGLNKKWGKGFIDVKILITSLFTTALMAGILWRAGIQNIIALIAITFSIGSITGLVVYYITNPKKLHFRYFIASHGTHIGFLTVVIAVAFSGPYQIKKDIALGLGASTTVGKYTFTLKQMNSGRSALGSNGKPNYTFQDAEVLVKKEDNFIGTLTPQLRSYAHYESNYYPKVSTLFSFGNELYAVFSGIDERGKAHLTVAVNPLINWLWIGGILMCTFPLFMLSRNKKIHTERKNNS